MNSGKKLLSYLSFLSLSLMLSSLFAASAALADGASVYTSNCGGCHRLGTYDTSGSAPDLLGKSSLIDSYYRAGVSGHKGITLTATNISELKTFITNPTTTSSPLAISTTTLAGGTVSAAYSQTLAASGGRSPYTWSRSAGTLPNGLTLSSAGVISGTPTASGTFNFTVTVTDSATTRASVNKALSITVSAASSALSITTSSLANATVGTAYSQTLAASGGRTPYTWSRYSGTLPTGLTINSSGVISGTPTATGTFSFTVRVRDSASTQASATKTLTITVNSNVPPLSITTASLPNGTVGKAYSQSLAVTGGLGPYSWNYSGPLPAGIVVTSSGLVMGTPTTAGNFSFTVLVSDSRSVTLTKTLTLTVTSQPMTDADKTLFNTNCAVCHTPFGLQNRTASEIRTAISGNIGGMGTSQLQALTSADHDGLARALSPSATPANNCATCHSSTTPPPASSPGQAIYDVSCAGCHSLGTYDASGSPNLLGRGSAVAGKFASAHYGITLNATDISNVTTFINSPSGTPSPTPTPTPTPTCGSCHGIPPSTGRHSRHSSYSCSSCHGSGYSKTAVNTATHNNGTKNVVSSTGWNASTRSCSSNSCHGSESW